MKRNRLVKYLMRTYLIGWMSWGMLILLIDTHVIPFSSPLGVILFAVGGYSPTIAALSVLEKRNPKSIATFIFNGNHKAVPYVFLFCLLLASTDYLSSRQFQPNMALYLFPVYWLEMMFVGGFEELGWRGVMQPTLEKSMPFPLSVLLTGMTWAVWHLPLWFVAGSGQSAFPFYVFAVSCVVLSFALAAIRKKTQSVIYCCIFHACSDALLAYIVIGTNYWVAVVGSVAIIVVSLLIWYGDRRKTAQKTRETDKVASNAELLKKELSQ